jgi:membrane-bound ClpP family serine protease
MQSYDGSVGGLNIRAEILLLVADPTTAYLVLISGGILILAEIMEPGRTLPGIAGAVMAILSVSILGGFQWTWYGEALVILALGLAVVRPRTSAYLLPSLTAVAFALGSALLLDGSTTIHPLAAVAGGIFAGTVSLLLRAGHRARSAKYSY